jgi:prolipoprotein diacylglyceryltransferase
MYPTLTQFFQDVFGLNIPLPIQTYGFFVAMAFLVGIWILSMEFKRKEREGILQSVKLKIWVGEPAKPKDLIISGIVGFIIGFKLLEAVLHYKDFVDNPQIFILSLRGSFIGGILGIAISIYSTWREKNKSKLDKPVWQDKEVFPHQLPGNILVVAGIFGLLGAKIFDSLEHIDSLISDPIGTIFSFSGLTFLGGFIVGSAAVIIYTRKYKIPTVQLLDVAAVGIPIAYAVGRIGCQISGDGCWGIPNLHPQPHWLSWLPDWTWAYKYPHNVINEGSLIPMCDGKHCHILDQPVWPTPFYETMLNLVFFAVLFSIRKIVKIPGLLISFYMILGGTERFFIELIRVNTKYHFFGTQFTQAEMISTFMVLAGIAGIVYLARKEKIEIRK